MTKIKGSKIKLNDLFKRFWFNIPEYQRHYVWQDDQINDLLDDLTFAFNNHPENEYYLGSLVLHKKEEIFSKISELSNIRIPTLDLKPKSLLINWLNLIPNEFFLFNLLNLISTIIFVLFLLNIRSARILTNLDLMGKLTTR